MQFDFITDANVYYIYINMNTKISFLQIMKDEINDLFNFTSIKNDIIKLTSIDSFLVFAV